MNELQAYYKAHGICVTCGHNEAAPGHTRCLDCLAKNAEYMRAHRKPLTAEQKEAKKQRGIKIRADRRANGKCIYCGKPLAPNNKYSCIDCWVKYRRRYEKRQSGKIARNERPSHGLCYRCGKPIESGSLCEECMQISINNLPTTHGNSV